MKANLRSIRTAALRLTALAAITLGLTVMAKPSTANAQVEYVRICEDYGPGFFFLPGTDVCFDVATDVAIEATDGGAWQWRVPNNPRTWAPAPQAACQNGQLVKFGDINSNGLVENAYSRYETKTHYKLRLSPGQYIASVLYKGGFTGTGVDPGNFCMFYYYNDPTNGPSYTPLGCIDTGAQAAVPATLAFSPDSPIPPATNDPVYILGANGDLWNVASASDIQGLLSVWLCLQNAPPPYGSSH
jgi:hypothetical protein